MKNTVAFPELFDKVFVLDPTAFELFGFEIKWYGIIICAGFLLAGLYAMRRAHHFGITADDITDYAVWLLPASIIGARLYYVIFRWDIYKNDLLSILKIRHGGLAIYGGIIAGVITAVVVSRTKHINFFSLGDIAVIALLIGQFIGRWGNFMNAEAFGGPTSLPWGMSINGGEPCHPTFLYESLWNFATFVALHFASKHRRFKGEMILLYFGIYGLGRAWIEGLRTDSLYIGETGIRVSQLLAAVLFIACTAALIYLYITKRYKKISFLKLESK